MTKSHKEMRKISKDGYGLEIKQTHQGILPPTDELIELEKECPGMIDRFMTLAEKDQEHYIKNDPIYFTKILHFQTFGSILGFLTVLSLNGLVAYMISAGLETGAIMTIVAEIAGLCGIYIKSRSKSLEEPKQ